MASEPVIVEVEPAKPAPVVMPRIVNVASTAGLIGYAYIGPYFGADFSAPQSETRAPVTLDAK